MNSITLWYTTNRPADMSLYTYTVLPHTFYSKDGFIVIVLLKFNGTDVRSCPANIGVSLT